MKPSHNLKSIVVATIIALAGFTPLTVRAVEPVTLTGALVTFFSILSPITGLISTVLDLAQFFGDYELIKTSYRTKEYRDSVQYSYRGSEMSQARTEWMVGDSGPYFRTDSSYRSPSGQLTSSHHSDPFPHALEQRTYRCSTADGMDVAIDSALALEIGYTASHAPSYKYFLSPNPMPVSVTFSGTYLTESCLDDPKGGFSMTRERSAMRDVWSPLALPSSKSVEISRIILTPHNK